MGGPVGTFATGALSCPAGTAALLGERRAAGQLPLPWALGTQGGARILGFLPGSLLGCRILSAFLGFRILAGILTRT